MSSAARIEDQTGHATNLGPEGGSPNVIIGGRKAWRAMVDYHTCPRSEGATPHVGGYVMSGSNSVLINGFPAVRQGDLIVEASFPNYVSGGENSVVIGDSAASRSIPLQVQISDLKRLSHISKYNIQGTIMFRGSQPLANAEIIVTGEGTHKITRTDRSGRYQILDLRTGKYRLKVKHYSYEAEYEFTIKNM